RPRLLVAAGNRLGRVVAERDDAVVGVHVHHPGAVGGALGLGELGVGDDDDQVAGRDQAGGGPVDADDAAAALPGQHVGDQAVAVVDVHHVDLLAVDQVGRVHQVGVDGDRADVVQIRLRDRGAVDLAVEHGAQHRG